MQKYFRSYNLAVEFYKLAASLSLPRHLKEQLVRASSSVALNLAEGSGRDSRADQRRFFHIAFGSLRESQAILDLASSSTKEAMKLADILAAHIYRLIQACGRG